VHENYDNINWNRKSQNKIRIMINKESDIRFASATKSVTYQTHISANQMRRCK